MTSLRSMAALTGVAALLLCSGAAALAAPAAPSPGPPRREPTAAELLRDDPGYAARERRLDALYQNAKERDPTGQVKRSQARALRERRACADRACLDAWFRQREAALGRYVQN